MSGPCQLLLLALVAMVLQNACSQDTLPEQGNKMEGDIVLTPEQQATLESTSNPNDPFAPQNAVVRNMRSLWPNGRVPYIFDGLNTRAQDAIRAAIATYTRLSCIRLVPRTNEADYVRFFPGGGCFSFIGRIGGPQDISIGSGCEFEGIVIHEIFHALGRWHEQSRPDRDMYVRINRENILSGRENNFEITNPSFVTTQGVPYDLGSIMHYGATAFSRNRQPTIEPVDPSIPLSSLGQRQGLSSRDLQHVQTLYCGSSPTPTGSWSQWSSWSACSRTCNGGSRTRTRVCNGGVDCEGSNIQNQQCNTNSCPVPSNWGAWSSWSGCSVSCGGGRQRRIRNCVGGNTCVGISNQFRDCNTNQCPQPATWGSWGSWSACSSTCQGGIRQRRRTCQNGNTCSGANFENQNCNTNIPCVSQPNPNSGEWSSWSACSAQCGGGQRFRSRLCGSNSCSTQTESCNTQDCNPEPNLRGIVYRGCWYFNNRAGLGTLEGRTPDLSDNPFTRVNPVGKCGVAAQGAGFRFFGVTIGYCVSGSNNLASYQYVRSSQCRDGRGNYNNGFFIMDVYEVTNQQAFMDSVEEVEQATTEQITTTEEGVGSADMQGGSGARPTAVFSMLSLLLVSMIGLILVL